jgi:hypothetical protein
MIGSSFDASLNAGLAFAAFPRSTVTIWSQLAHPAHNPAGFLDTDAGRVLRKNAVLSPHYTWGCRVFSIKFLSLREMFQVFPLEKSTGNGKIFLPKPRATRHISPLFRERGPNWPMRRISAVERVEGMACLGHDGLRAALTLAQSAS